MKLYKNKHLLMNDLIILSPRCRNRREVWSKSEALNVISSLLLHCTWAISGNLLVVVTRGVLPVVSAECSAVTSYYTRTVYLWC